MLSEKALRAAAKEVNDVVGVEPPINTKAPVAELIEKLKEAKDTVIDPDQDEFTEATQAVLDELDAEEEAEEEAPAPKRKVKPAPVAEEAEEDDPEEAEEAPKKKAPKKKGTAPKKAGEPGKPGIIATIVALVEGSGKKGITKEEILAELVANFPDRSEDSMKNTINVQVPARINKEKFPVKKLEGNRYCKA